MNLYPPGVWFADAVSSFSDTFVSLCFRFRFFAFTEAAALRSIVLRSSICMRPLQPHLCFPVFHIFCFFGYVAFSEYFVPLLSFYLVNSIERTSYVFPFRMVFFYLVTMGCIFDI